MNRQRNKIPDRWEEYTTMGRVIPGTRFIAFKVPLREEIMQKAKNSEWFCPRTLMDHCHNLGLVIDLTATDRYYCPSVFESKGITHRKILTQGHMVPEKKVVKKFVKSVNSFLDKNKENDKLIGVHCTHGVNRTGYLVCRYMIQELGIPPDQAIADFNSARGHALERENYLVSLRHMPGSTNATGSEDPDDANQSYTPSGTVKADDDDDSDTTTSSEDGEQNDSAHDFSLSPPTGAFSLNYCGSRSAAVKSLWNADLRGGADENEADRQWSAPPIRTWKYSPRQSERLGKKKANAADGKSPRVVAVKHKVRHSPYGARKYYDQRYQGRVAPQYDSHFYQDQGSGIGPHRPMPRYQKQLQQMHDNAPRKYRGPRPYRSPPESQEPPLREREAPGLSSSYRDYSSTSHSQYVTPKGPRRNPRSPGTRDNVFSPTTPRRSARMTPY